jgi:putative ABC transport system permease protein
VRAVVGAAWAAVRRRRLQSLIIAVVVLLSSGTAVLALGLLVASSAPFDRAFDRQRGAHAAATFDAAKVSAAALSGTADRPGVTATAGPYDAVSAQLRVGTLPLMPPGLVVGRADAATPVDRLNVTAGHWLTGPGQIVVSRETPGRGRTWQIGDRLTVDLPGAPTVRVVGIADSVTDTADAWVWPTQTDILHAGGSGGSGGTVASRQMLYRFASAGTDSAVRASLDTATATLPNGALVGSSTYLAVKLHAAENIKPIVPFVIAFAVLGLVLSVLIVVNVVAGAVVAGFRTIGMQKTLGFTPGQVVGVYAGQILAVCLPAALVGVGLGRLLSLPILAETAEAYDVPGATAVPAWVDLLVLVGVSGTVGLAAVATAARAGRLSAVQAITVGRAPRAGHGFRVRRALAATRLPRPVGFGLGTPFARPARSAVTVVAVLLGATTLVFAAGLATSLSRVVTVFDRTSAIPVGVSLMVGRPGGPAAPGAGQQGAGQPGAAGQQGPAGQPAQAADPAAVRATIQAQPGTTRVVGMTPVDVSLAGSTETLNVRAYDGDASWVGYPLLSGRWYHGPDEAVASSRMLRLTGTKVGDHITIATPLGRHRVQIVGEAFTNGRGGTMIMDMAGLAGLVEHPTPTQFEVGLTHGTDPRAYVGALSEALGSAAIPQVTADTQAHETIGIAFGLIATLTLLLSAVAALGVFNTVVLNTRERTHEIGVLKSIGMTPAQVRVTVVTSMLAIGLLGGALAVPLGFALHRWILRAIADAAGSGVPADVVTVYSPVELVGLGATGVALAVLGALVPAGWAARTRAAAALRAE